MILTSVIRTIVQGIITALLALGPVQSFVAWLEAQGVAINWDDVSTWVAVFVLGAVTALVNWASGRWPVIAKIISLGRSDTPPLYSPPQPPAPEAVE